MRSVPSSNSDWSAYVREIGTNIQRHRVARGYSQDRVAYEANLSRYTFQKLEKGESRPDSAANPRLMTLLAIAQVLDIELSELLPPRTPDLTLR
ncbi:DNA-binding helix-turn-helix protein [Microbacterium sp. C448]|uniref:helix-turn-helix domain-containing protein n=1 Tax=Microbacterium sp. C448 TaxID=1177594 RepID=UPI0003DE3DA0|nr:helix-turn-helix transcriptional regulator [Microbacterium sp. C448]CDJ99535.1 DNA-binding helix-turn-helix protein [Microbacterium sp. C448]